MWIHNQMVYTLRANLPRSYFPFGKSPLLLVEHKKGRKPLRSRNRQTAFSNRQTSLPHLSQKSLRNRIISSQYWEFVSNLLSKADFAQYEPPSMVVDLKVGHLFFGPVGPNIIHSASPFVGSYLKTLLYDFLSPKLGLLSFPSTFFFSPFQHLFHLTVFSIYKRNEKKLQKNVAEYEYGLIVGIWHMTQIGGEFKGIAWSKGCCTRELVTEEYSELPLSPFAGQGNNFRFRGGVKD